MERKVNGRHFVEARSTRPLDRNTPATKYVLPEALRGRRAALVVAHPGHELGVHGWMELAHPVVCVLTDGSGHTGQSRLRSTTRLLAKVCAPLGAIYGRFADVDVYAAILDKDVRFFLNLAEELAQILVRDEIQYVVGDPIEGYNPTHDMCRALINSAVELARRTSKRPIANFDFRIVIQQDRSVDDTVKGKVSMHLDEVAMNRKLAAVGSYSELSSYISNMINEFGTEIVQIESLQPVHPTRTDPGFLGVPFYEEYGEKQVAAGIYSRVIRYREHILPISTALMAYAHK